MIAYVTDVLEQHFPEACMLYTPDPPADLPPNFPKDPCASPQAMQGFTHVHDAWAKPGIVLPPQSQVQVGAISVNGNTATVSDTDITVDGHTLNALMLIGSQNAGSVHMQWTLQQQNGRWYIGSEDLKGSGSIGF